MAMVGVTSMLALVGPPISPGPVIGPGGYLGAAGRALLEMNFATTGAFILGLSLLLGGLLLSTDYVLIRLIGFLLKLPLGLFALSLRSSSNRPRPIANDDLADASAELSDAEPAVVIRGKRSKKAGGVAAGK